MAGSFVTTANFLTRYDWRLIAQMVSDTGTADSQGAVATDPNLLQILQDASGEVLMYAIQGGRYSQTDLDNLTDISKAQLQRLVSDIAIWFIVLRRGLPVDEYPQCRLALEMLKLISEGEEIFNVQANIDASVAQSPDVSIQSIANNNFLVDNAYRYFPTRRFTTQQI